MKLVYRHVFNELNLFEHKDKFFSATELEHESLCYGLLMFDALINLLCFYAYYNLMLLYKHLNHVFTMQA